MTASVVARTHPIKDTVKTWYEDHGTLLSKIIEHLSPLAKRLPIALQLNGVPVPKHLWSEVSVKTGDLVNLRVMPAGGKGGLGLVGAGVGIGGLLLARLLGGGSNSAGQAATQNNELAPPPEPAPDPDPVPVDGFGGYKDTVVPQIVGVTNQSNEYNAVTRVYGRYRINPVLAAQPYYEIVGNDQYLRAVFSCGYGRLDISDIKIGVVPIGDYVTAGICQYEVLSGVNPDSEAITLYPSDVASTNIGSVLSSTPQLVVAPQYANELSVLIEFPNGLYGRDEPTWKIIDQTSGATISGPNPATDFYANVPITCSFQIQYRLYGSGGAWTTRTLSVSGNETGVKRVGDSWTVSTPGLYEVRVSKTSSDSVISYETTNPTASTVKYQHYVTPVQVASFVALEAKRTNAPINKLKDKNGATIPMTFIAVRIKASELINGTLDNLSCYCQSYLRKWNGSAWTSPAITANPAWILADILTGTANNKDLDDTYLDLSVLKDWADFCDSKGFEFNGVFDDLTTLPDALKTVAACGRASINVVDGLIGVVVDKPRSTVVQMITAANSWGLKYKQVYPRIPHAVRVNFVNPDADWVTDQRTVFADGYTADNATIYETYEYKGVTNATQAYKLARYQLAVALLRPARWTVNMDWAHLIVNRGDRVQLNYDVTFTGLDSALIDSTVDDGTNMTGLVLNQQLFFDSTLTYGIKIQRSDGTITSHAIVTGTTGYRDTIQLSTPISLVSANLPVRNNLIAFGYYGNEVADMIVVGIKHNAADRSATLTLADYSPAIYDADTGTIPAYTPNVSVQHPTRRTIEAPTVLGVKSDETALIRGSNGSLVSRIQITVQPPLNGIVAYVEAQYKLSGSDNYLPGGSSPHAGTYTTYITDVQDGQTYDVRLKFVDRVGISSAWTTFSHTVIGKTTPPPDVPDIRLQEQIALFPYDISSGVSVPLDFAGFRLKYALGQTNNWDQASLITQLTSNQQFDLSVLPQGPISFMVKAVDTAGNESTNAAVLYKNIVGTYTQNLYVSFAENPAWTGSITNGTINGSHEIIADDSGGTFWPASSSSPFWNSNPSALFWSVSYDALSYEWTYTPDPTIRDPYKVFVDYTVDAEVYFVEYKRQSQAPFWATDSDSLFWPSDSAALFWDDGSPWLPYPQSGLDGAHETYRFRIRCLPSTVKQSKISAITTRVDVPDVEETIEQTITAGGARLALTKTYSQIVDCQVSLLYDASHASAFTVQIIDKDTSGPLIKVFNVSGVSVTGLINARIKGY